MYLTNCLLNFFLSYYFLLEIFLGNSHIKMIALTLLPNSSVMSGFLHMQVVLPTCPITDHSRMEMRQELAPKSCLDHTDSSTQFTSSGVDAAISVTDCKERPKMKILFIKYLHYSGTFIFIITTPNIQCVPWASKY